MERKTFHLAGHILDTDVPRLKGVLLSDRWEIRDRGEELELDADDLSIAIYPSGPGKRHGEDFLLSGELEGEPEQVRDALQAIARGLGAVGLVYNLELAEPGADGDELVLRHPDFAASRRRS